MEAILEVTSQFLREDLLALASDNANNKILSSIAQQGTCKVPVCQVEELFEEKLQTQAGLKVFSHDEFKWRSTNTFTERHDD